MQSSSEMNQEESGVYIQPSRRPDGSLRKAIRVKAGYVPQDEVPLYESKGKQFVSRQSSIPVGLDPSHVKNRPVNPNNPIPGLVIVDADVKKKKKKKPQSESSNTNSNTQTNKASKKDASSNAKSKTKTTNADDLSSLPPEELEKRIKNLKKKVREIKTLEQKIENGELKNPEKDQKEKLLRKPELLSEIMALKLCLHGEEGVNDKDD